MQQMRRIMIIRFGETNVKPFEKEILRNLPPVDAGQALVCRVGSIGMAFCIYTYATPKQIENIFYDVLDNEGNLSPMVIFDMSSIDNAFLSMLSYPEVNKMVETFNHMIDELITSDETLRIEREMNDRINSAPTLSMDELLDRISEHGMQGLLPQEKKRLDELSK